MRIVLLAALTVLAGCAQNMAGSRDVRLSIAVVRAGPATGAADVADALRQAGTDVALVVASGDAPWFREVAEAASLHLSGPGHADGLHLGFMGPEAVGDTTIELSHAGGSFMLHDALYSYPGGRYLDLLAFRVERAEDARPAMDRLLRYIATDVLPHAAVVMAVAVPDAEVGDAVARRLSPGFYDSRHCPARPGSGPAAGGMIRMFYGPEARISCQEARLDPIPGGQRIQARLVMVRR